MSGKYTAPKPSMAPVVSCSEWCNQYVTTPLNRNEFSTGSSPFHGQTIAVASSVGGNRTENIPLCQAGIVFTNFKILHPETTKSAPMITATPVAFVHLDMVYAP